jgi:membrane protein DedA with SNARE-associated domain
MGIVTSAGYFGILLLMFIENVFPPIPSEIIMPLAGYMATHGELSLLGIILAGTIGSVLGALPLYYVGRTIGGERLKKFADKRGRWLTVSREDIEQAERWFDRYGNAAILFCRLIPGVRSLISIPAGIAGMKMVPFIFYTAVGTAVWTALLAYSGYFLGSNFAKISDYLDPVSWIVLGIIVVIYFVGVIRHKNRL